MNTKNAYAILLCWMLLSSCSTIKIKDSEFCGDMGSEGATCFKTLSGESREISPNDWDDERFGMICSSAKTFADWKKAILKLCDMTNRCEMETKKKIDDFGQNVESFDLKIKALRPYRNKPHPR